MCEVKLFLGPFNITCKVYASRHLFQKSGLSGYLKENVSPVLSEACDEKQTNPVEAGSRRQRTADIRDMLSWLWSQGIQKRGWCWGQKQMKAESMVCEGREGTLTGHSLNQPQRES